MASYFWLSMLFFYGTSSLVLNTPQVIGTSVPDLLPPQVSSLSSSSSSSSSMQLNISSLLAARPECDARLHGSPSLSSCVQALSRMPVSSGDGVVLFTTRPAQRFAQYTSPYRAISPDGLCVIDVELRVGVPNELVKPNDLKSAATAAIRDCVQGSSSGGSIGELGLGGRLTVIVSQYVPNVVCRYTPDPPDPKMCGHILQAIPASGSMTIFGNAPGPDVQFRLPKGYIDETHNCALKFELKGSSERTTWYNLWAVAVATVGMCLARGQIGEGVLQVGGSDFVVILLKTRPDRLGAENSTDFLDSGAAQVIGPANITLS